MPFGVFLQVNSCQNWQELGARWADAESPALSTRRPASLSLHGAARFALGSLEGYRPRAKYDEVSVIVR